MFRRSAHGRYVGRTKELDRVPDGKLVSDAKDTIHIGRRTVLEIMFFEGLFASMRDHDAAVCLLNSHIGQMEKCSIVQDEIEPSVWNFVSQVLRGKKLKSF